MAGLMKALKRTFMSELLKKADLRVDEGHVRLSITREKFVVLGLVATTNYKHAELSIDEFQQFHEAVKSMQQALRLPDAVPPLES